MRTGLTPAQRQAFDEAQRCLRAGNIVVLRSAAGMGRTTVLRELHHTLGPASALLTMKPFLDALRGEHPLALEETFEQMMTEALADHEVLLLDDLHLLTGVTLPCGFAFYPRSKLLHAPLAALAAYAGETGKKLVFGEAGDAPQPIHQRCYYSGIAEFTAADYAALCKAYLGPEYAAGLDFARIHRFAPKLNAHQLRGACEYLRQENAPDDERFIDYLRSQRLVSNVDLGEVQAVDLRSLKGLDDVIESLEANIILPLENDALATELGITPKRGVLLAGPPGTGKTTVGRALAHRLRSKFFLIDGTFISGTHEFYERVHRVFEAAKQNAPSILFVDDSDVIFQNGAEAGLYRYLLTMLDGLESESAGRVCVMMTAMDVGALPPALLRSGRIELWLETRLPDEAARAQILEVHAAELPPALGSVDVASIAAATEGMTGADLKRLIEDGKILFAYDRVRGLPLRPHTDYFLAAVATVRANKERYAEAEARARRQRPARPAFFDIFGGASAGDGG